MLSERVRAAMLTSAIVATFLLVWYGLTLPPKFDAMGLSEDELMVKEFNGDIVRNDFGEYVFNPDKALGLPGPGPVARKAYSELSEAFHKKGTNDHGVAYLVLYTVIRFGSGFFVASVVAVLLGVAIGLSPLLFRVAWMPLLLYSVKDPTWTAILVVFMAALWPTVANTAFGVNSIRSDYLRVSALLELGWFERLYRVVLPGAAPAIVAGLRIAFGSALVAVVPAEMLLGELGIGYLTWIEWNNLDISGVVFAILVVGVVGITLDTLFNRVSKMVTYPE